MPKPLAVALLGLWHVHAVEYARAAVEHPGTLLSAVWDPDAAEGSAAATELDVPFVDDLDQLLARDDIDAVIVTTSTDLHADVITRAANAGKHIFSEKLLAPTVVEAERLVSTAESNGVVLVVSLPRLTESTTLAALRLIEDGSLGKLTYSRVRMAHDGWVNGWLPERFADRSRAVGGALSDLGCHPAYLTQHFLGTRPSTVSASYTHSTDREVEDNAVVTVTYTDGAIGVFEASFVTTPGAFAMELRGTEGSLLYGFGGERFLAKGENFDGEQWVEIALPLAGPDPFHQWVQHIRDRSTATENLSAAVELTRIVVAANDAAARGTTIAY